VSQGSNLLFGSMVRAVLISASAFSSSDILRYAWDLLYRAFTLNGSCSMTWYKAKRYKEGIHIIKLKHSQLLVIKPKARLSMPLRVQVLIWEASCYGL
jgi:hypothetical protein